jgi:cytochrome c oxidase assembly protein subunit 15
VRSFSVTPGLYRRITLLAVAALTAIILSGAAVRLTDSGLGCPDWPTCAQHHLVAAWQYHAVVEFANRCFTVVVSIAIALAVLGALLRGPRRRDLVMLSVGLLLGIVAQIVLGGLTVIYKLAPPFVMAHFLLSIALLWDALVLHHRAGQPATPARPVVRTELVWLGRLTMAVTAAVIGIGTAVTGAGPHAGSAQAPRLAVNFRDVAEVHSTLVMLLVGLTIAGLFAARLAGAPRDARRAGWFLIGAIAAQAAIGYTQYFLRVPAFLVELHVAGATAVWMCVVALNLSLFARAPEPAAPASAEPPKAPPEQVLAPT